MDGDPDRKRQDSASGSCQSHPRLRQAERHLQNGTRLHHVEESMRGGRQAIQDAQSRHTPQHPEILYGIRPEEKGRTVQNQIYTVASWSQRTETRTTPTVN